MNYCEICGNKLELKTLEYEGKIPFCSKCGQYRFEKFNAAVSMVVVNKEMNKTLLIKQYNRDRYILVAGYINKGESAEEAAIRELKEEVSLNAIKLIFQKTKYFEKTNTLMINFIAVVEDESVSPNYEVDDYAWVNIEEALDRLERTTLAYEFYNCFYERKHNYEI